MLPVIQTTGIVLSGSLPGNNAGNVTGGISSVGVHMCSGMYWSQSSMSLMSNTGLVFATGITYAQAMQDTTDCYVGYFKIDKTGPIEAGLYDVSGRNVWTAFSHISSLQTVRGVGNDYLIIKMPANYITFTSFANRIGVVSRDGRIIITPKPIVETSLRYEGDGKFSATIYDSSVMHFTK